MKRSILPSLLALPLLTLGSGCVTHSHITDFNGVDGIRGEPVEYQVTTSYALHLLYIFSLLGDANKGNVVEEFTAEAADRGAERVRIVETSTEIYWYLFLPFTFFIQPVVTTVSGEVEGTV
ncbi:MAG: hypothetical protein AAF682_17305 [Planctomycetota bacterium]